jgi:RNA polymerase sigma-70 factor (sigma-E family)
MARPPSDEAFTEFVVASWPSLYRTAYLLLGDRGLAEDLVQTSLSKTYASWGKVREVGAARSYARTTLMNTAASWFRKRGWRSERPTETVEGGAYDEDPSVRPTVMAALGQLAPRQRAVVVLRFYEDLSVADTAHALHCSEGTVKSQTSDALTKLRGLLGEVVLPLETGTTHD